MKSQLKFEWRHESGNFYLCTVSIDGSEVYEAGGTFPAGGPSENTNTRIAYEQEIWEEYTGAFVA
jgi:hypothetical protein